MSLEEILKDIVEKEYEKVTEELKVKIGLDALRINEVSLDWSPVREYMVFSFLAKIAKEELNEFQLEEARKVVKEAVAQYLEVKRDEETD